MAEELTSGAQSAAAPSPETGGQAQGSGRTPQFGGRGTVRDARGEGVQQPAEGRPSQAGQTSQPTKPGGETPPADTPKPDEAKAKGFNLFEDESFRKVQSAWQRQMADLQRQNNELAGRVKNAEMKGLDDFEKLQYEKQELERAIQQMNQQRDLEIMAYQRQQDINQIAEQTGVDASEIEQATDYANAWQRAALNLRGRVAELEKQIDRLENRKKEANAPYLGGGAGGNAGGDDLSAAYDAAKRSRDPAAWVRAVRESKRS